MDSRDNFLIKFNIFINSINDDYLIGLSNKGIFNRASKDMEKAGAIKITVEDKGIKCELPDGNICIVSEEPKKFKCSCPSRTICKHVIMSYLGIMKQGLGLTSDEDAENHNAEILSNSSKVQTMDFSELLNIELKSIKKSVGDRVLGSIVKRLEFGLKAEIEEKNILTIAFKEEDISVKFVPFITENNGETLSIKDSTIMNNALCSCKDKELCSHKAEALIHYSLHKGKISYDTIKALIEEDENISTEVFKDVLTAVKNNIEEIYSIGLSRFPENFTDTIEQLALICHNSNLPRMEKSLRALSFELQLYLSKNTLFSLQRFRSLLQRIYSCAAAVMKGADKNILKKLVGEHKSSYYEMPPIELHAIGAEAWASKSGYQGITCYFINPSIDRYFTYTVSRPTYYDGGGAFNLLEQSSPWGIKGKLSEVSRCSIKLIKGKVNDEFRLSSSEECIGEVLGRTQINNTNLKEKVIDSWKVLFLKLEELYLDDLQERREKDNLFLLKISSFGRSSFNNIHQSFTMPIYDSENRKINIKLNYNNISKRIIENLERVERLQSFPYMLLCEVYIDDEGIAVVPITAYFEGGIMQNWTLELGG
jgi:hypothetical protein